MNAYKIYFTVMTGDGKIVGIFKDKANAIKYINEFQRIFTSDLRINEIYTDIF